MSQSPPPIRLGYESGESDAVGRRPKWVWIVVVIYLLFAAAVVLLPLAAITSGDVNVIIAASVAATVLTLCGLGLLITPVKLTRRRPVTRRTVWIPVLVSGFLVGLLVYTTGAALEEYFLNDRDYFSLNGAPDPAAQKHEQLESRWEKVVIISAASVWLFWLIIFGLLTVRFSPAGVAMKLHRLLLAGSVAELLVAVPTHIIVRRRNVCCAGIMTGTAICVGVAVMVVAFGPSVFFLYHRRWKQIKNG